MYLIIKGKRLQIFGHGVKVTAYLPTKSTALKFA